jgi:Methyltransferase domain
MRNPFKAIRNKLLQRKPFRSLPHDDFILRLRSSVIGEGMLHPGNIYLMDLAIQQMPDGGCVLEIGSYGGLSANLMTYLIQKHARQATLFCCDAWVYEGYHDENGAATDWMDGRNDVLRTDFMAHIKASFVQSTRLLSGHRLPHAFHLDSDSFFEAWKVESTLTDVFGRNAKLGGPIAFAYIDGNHAYDFARRDVENTAAFLLPGGLLLLDDSAKHQRFGSVRLAQELCKHPGFELILSNPHYLFRKKR